MLKGVLLYRNNEGFKFCIRNLETYLKLMHISFWNEYYQIFDRIITWSRKTNVNIAFFVLFQIFQKSDFPELIWSFYAKLVNGCKSLTIFTKGYALDVCQGSRTQFAICIQFHFSHNNVSNGVSRTRGNI